MRKLFVILILALLVLTVYYHSKNSSKSDQGRNKNRQVMMMSKDSITTSERNLLVEAEGVLTVRAYCTGCHSEKLVAQNRATREGWESMIRWMQETQNLGDLGENERKILDYLAENYAPDKKGRREPLSVEWYILAD